MNIPEFIKKLNNHIWKDPICPSELERQLRFIETDLNAAGVFMQLDFQRKIIEWVERNRRIDISPRFLNDWRYNFKLDTNNVYISIFCLSILETIFMFKYRRDLNAIKCGIWHRSDKLRDAMGQLEVARMALTVYNRPSYTYTISGRTFITINEMVHHNKLIQVETTRRKCDWWTLIRVELESNVRLKHNQRDVSGIMEMLSKLEELYSPESEDANKAVDECKELMLTMKV